MLSQNAIFVHFKFVATDKNRRQTGITQKQGLITLGHIIAERSEANNRDLGPMGSESQLASSTALSPGLLYVGHASPAPGGRHVFKMA